jgi:hypothetical protein
MLHLAMADLLCRRGRRAAFHVAARLAEKDGLVAWVASASGPTKSEWETQAMGIPSQIRSGGMMVLKLFSGAVERNGAIRSQKSADIITRTDGSDGSDGMYPLRPDNWNAIHVDVSLASLARPRLPGRTIMLAGTSRCV